jgi:hypothetical protein
MELTGSMTRMLMCSASPPVAAAGLVSSPLSPLSLMLFEVGSWMLDSHRQIPAMDFAALKAKAQQGLKAGESSLNGVRDRFNQPKGTPAPGASYRPQPSAAPPARPPAPPSRSSNTVPSRPATASPVPPPRNAVALPGPGGVKLDWANLDPAEKEVSPRPLLGAYLTAS